jgi:hypothetical protein
VGVVDDASCDVVEDACCGDVVVTSVLAPAEEECIVTVAAVTVTVTSGSDEQLDSSTVTVVYAAPVVGGKDIDVVEHVSST